MMGDPATPALIALLLPAAAFLVLAILAPFRRLGRPAGLFSALCALGALAAALSAVRLAGDADDARRLAVDWLPSSHGAIATVGVLVDGQSSIMLVLVALVATLVQVYSLGYLDHEPPASLGRYYAYQSLFAFSMMGLVLAPNLLQMFLCWELVGLCSYLLIGYWYQKPEAARAAVKAFWITKAGDVGLLIGLVLLWKHAGTYDLGELQRLAGAGLVPLAGLSAITFCLYLGAAGKSAQFPFHIWLPDAMEGPTPVSALIHAATMVTAGVYLLVRTAWLFALTPEILHLVGWIGAGTALVAAILACAQDDIKRVLAYSTVSQLGFMMTAIGAGAADAGFFHLLTHGVFKALLFLAAGAVIHAVGTNDIRQMGGLGRRMPQTTAVFLIGTLSLAGVPFFGGFLSKEEILGGVWAGGLPGPFALLAIAAFLTAFYMFRVVFLTFFGGAPVVAAVDNGADAHGASHGAHDAPAVMGGPLWVLALLSLAIGLFFTWHHAPIEEQPAPAWLTPLAIGLALGGIGLAWSTYQRRLVQPRALALAMGPLRTAALHRFWIDDMAIAFYSRVLLGGSRVVGWIDRYLVDGLLNVVSAWVLVAGDRLRRVQTGRVQDYVYAVAFGVLAVIVWLGWAR
ncbi:MAG: NADH-quinone oxidoreductase subunit L [Acidobacteria bacterium]|nr:NADH-quinone oxidoreductase subunit L [Acidobacteriota bacterium]